MQPDPLTLYKLMVLYMLRQVKFPLRGSQISEFFLGKEYTNYFTLQQALDELVEAHLITQEALRTLSQYEITREGEEALGYFGSGISQAIRDDIDTFLKENKFRLRNEVSVIADYSRSENGDYLVRCEVREVRAPLIALTVSVPTEQHAELVCRNWQKKNQRLYSYLMEELIAEEKKEG